MTAPQLPPGPEDLVALLPFYAVPTVFLMADGLPCHGAQIQKLPIDRLLKKLKRQVWVEGLYVKKNDLARVFRYKNPDGSYKNDFDENQFLAWVKNIEENTALCEMENTQVGKGIFVPPGKKFPKASFIPASGIIKLDPGREELETRVHCSALQDLNSPQRKIYGLIDPEIKGGILDLINHAPDREEMANFSFKKPSVKQYAATSNLQSVIKFYQGYAIMGVEAREDIDGGEHGRQLLWSYARPDEYLALAPFQAGEAGVFLFDNRSEHNGEVLDASRYALRKINIFIDSGEPILRQVASVTRWELMTSAPETGLLIASEDPYSSTQSDPIQSSIPHGFLQAYLKQNPLADRIIISVPRGQA